MLNPDSPIPLYRQLADILLNRIRSGEYPQGSKIPSEHQLTTTFSIGRPTARQATDFLVRKQILVRKRGSGTFVLKEPQQVDLFSLAGTLSAFEKKGLKADRRIVSAIGQKSILNHPDNPFNGRVAYFFSRLTQIAGEPVLLEDIYLDPLRFTGLERFDLAEQALSQIVEEHFFLTPLGGRQTFKIGYLNNYRATLMNISENAPILIVQRFLDFFKTPNAIYAELYCRTDKFAFSQTLGGNKNV